MSAHIPPGFAEVSIPFLHTGNARQAFITFGVNVESAAVTGILLADAIGGVFTDEFGPSIDTEVVIGPVYLVVGQDGPADLPFSGAFTEAGGRSMAADNSAVALMFDKHTDRPGRRGRGRFYVPWMLADTDVDENGRVLTAFIESFDVIGLALLDALADPALDAPMVLLHGTPIPAGVVPDPVVALTADPIIGIQKRRLNR
jgi:hypothetical protein